MDLSCSLLDELGSIQGEADDGLNDVSPTGLSDDRAVELFEAIRTGEPVDMSEQELNAMMGVGSMFMQMSRLTGLPLPPEIEQFVFNLGAIVMDHLDGVDPLELLLATLIGDAEVEITVIGADDLDDLSLVFAV